MPAVRWLDLSLADAVRPVRRAGFVARIDPGAGLVLQSADGRARHVLNRTAALVWQLADGTRAVSRFSSDARGTHPDAWVSRRDAEALLCELAGKGVVAISPKPAKSQAPPLVRVGFTGFAGDFPPVINAFTAILAQRITPLVVDPAHEPADILFISNARPSNPSIRSSQSTALRVFVDVGGGCPPPLALNLVIGSRKPAAGAESWMNIDPSAWLKEDRATWPDRPGETALLHHVIGSNDDSATRERAPGSYIQPKLTIGMAAYDDFDGVYFTLQGLRLYHGEVANELEFLVIDNNPGSLAGEAVSRLANGIPNLRYVPCGEFNGTAIRDFVFRYANGEYVLCIDSHVLIEPGALRKLLDYLDARADCKDLLQGPLVFDDLSTVATHCDPVWRGGMFGTWGCDPRGIDRDAAPFEIPLQGLGLFCCRKDAWPGFHPSFRGFGGEEGYLHEKFRRAGRRTLCLPFLRWIHRFGRPAGQQYPNLWDDRMRNYYLGCEELGLDTQPVDDHFREHVGPALVDHVRRSWNVEQANPFRYFDIIYRVGVDGEEGRRGAASNPFESLGIGKLVRRFDAVGTPENRRLMSHRAIIEYAAQCNFESVLVLEDDAVFRRDALTRLRVAVDALPSDGWWILDLSGGDRGAVAPITRHCPDADASRCTSSATTAVAYHRDSYAFLLEALPSNPDETPSWLAKHHAMDRFLRDVAHRVVLDPPIAEPRAVLMREDDTYRSRFCL